MKKFGFKWIVIVGTGITLSSCSMVPEYVRPSFSASTQWNEIPGYEKEKAQIAASKVTWQEFFTDPSLQKVVQTTLDNNKNLKLAALNIQEARRLYRIERANLLPSPNANIGANYQKISDNASLTGRGESAELYTANIGESAYELDLFGRLRSQNEAALNEYFATQAARDAVQNSLIAEVANAYLQLLSDQELLNLTQKTLEAQQRTYDILLRIKQEGIATESDVSRAQTAVEKARVNLYLYRRFVEQDKNALILLMGVAHDEMLIPDLTLAKINLPINLDAGIPSEVLIARPDIQQAEYELLARNADIGAARAAFFPKVSLTGTYGFASEGLSSLFTSGGFGAWTFIPQITLPIFNAGKNQANLDLSEIRKEKAVVQYEKVIQVAFREVADELAARTTLTEQLESQRRLVAAAERVHNISNERYKAGIDSFLSVLDSQRELYSFQQNEIETERQRLSNLIDLYKVLGGGASQR